MGSLKVGMFRRTVWCAAKRFFDFQAAFLGGGLQRQTENGFAP